MSIDMNVLLGLIAGLLAGCFLGWFPHRHKNQQIEALQISKDELTLSYQELETLFAERQADIDLLAGELTDLKVINATLNERVEQTGKALTDLEFAKYLDDSSFISITQ